jgi:hypothetical protein
VDCYQASFGGLRVNSQGVRAETMFGAPLRRDRDDYLIRRQTTSALPPPEAAAVVYFNSSPETVKGRFYEGSFVNPPVF